MSLFVVTGGAGFIGSHLTDRLLAIGHEVRVVDDLSTGFRRQVDARAEFIAGDVADRALMGEVAKGADGVFHLAAVASVQRSNEDWVGTHRTNLSGTVAVLDAARAAGKLPVVYASSSAVYGDQGPDPIREDARPRPRTAYGADKLGCELHAAVAAGVHGVSTLGCRLFNVYGPRQDPSSPYSGVISIFARRIQAGLPIMQHGDGLQMRDFVHVSDVVQHLLLGMAMLRADQGADQGVDRRAQARIFNICTGRATTIAELIASLAEVTQRAPIIERGPAREGDIRVSVGDPGEATHALGIHAVIGLAEGLRSLVRAGEGALAK